MATIVPLFPTLTRRTQIMMDQEMHVMKMMTMMESWTQQITAHLIPIQDKKTAMGIVLEMHVTIAPVKITIAKVMRMEMVEGMLVR